MNWTNSSNPTFLSALRYLRRNPTMFHLSNKVQTILKIYRLFQERSRTNVKYAAKPSASPPTSSPTAASTRGSSPSRATCAAAPSSARWICGDTRRHNTRRCGPQSLRSVSVASSLSVRRHRTSPWRLSTGSIRSVIPSGVVKSTGEGFSIISNL